MKLTNALLSVLLFTLLISCNKPTEPLLPEPDELRLKSGQVFALIDGTEWKSCRKSPMYPPTTSYNRDGYWDLQAVDYCGSGTIYFYILDWLREGTFVLGDSQGSFGMYWSDQKYFTTRQYTGTITITKIDSVVQSNGRKVPYQLSGEFSFRALGNDSTTVVEVLEGKINKATVSN